MSQDENNSKNNEEIVEENNEAEIKSEEDTSKKINSEEDEDNSEEEDDGEQGDELDYKSEYERLQGELAKKNERIAKQDKKIIKLKRKEEYQDDDEEDNSENKGDNTDLDEVVAKKVQEQMSSFVEDTIDDEISKLSQNEDEKKLIKWYFDNRIVKTGWAKKDIIQYLGEAKALANAKKLITTSKMLAKKVKSEDTKGTPNFAGTPPKQSPKVTEHDKQMAAKFFKGDINKWLKYKS